MNIYLCLKKHNRKHDPESEAIALKMTFEKANNLMHEGEYAAILPSYRALELLDRANEQYGDPDDFPLKCCGLRWPRHYAYCPNCGTLLDK